MAVKTKHSAWVRGLRLSRDAEWTRLVLGITDRVLTPEEAAKWLENDRIERARNVSDARVRRGPQWS